MRIELPLVELEVEISLQHLGLRRLLQASVSAFVDIVEFQRRRIFHPGVSFQRGRFLLDDFLRGGRLFVLDAAAPVPAFMRMLRVVAIITGVP